MNPRAPKLALQSIVFAAALPLAAQLPASAHTSSGLEIPGTQLTLRIDALRPDVLRIRMWPTDRPAEDASWAVLPAARTARVTVTAELDGFSTTALRVKVGTDLRLTVSDLNGNVLQQDALPVNWIPESRQIPRSFSKRLAKCRSPQAGCYFQNSNCGGQIGCRRFGIL